MPRSSYRARRGAFLATLLGCGGSGDATTGLCPPSRRAPFPSPSSPGTSPFSAFFFGCCCGLWQPLEGGETPSAVHFRSPTMNTASSSSSSSSPIPPAFRPLRPPPLLSALGSPLFPPPIPSTRAAGVLSCSGFGVRQAEHKLEPPSFSSVQVEQTHLSPAPGCCCPSSWLKRIARARSASSSSCAALPWPNACWCDAAIAASSCVAHGGRQGGGRRLSPRGHVY